MARSAGGIIRINLPSIPSGQKLGPRRGKNCRSGRYLTLALAWLSGTDYAFVGTAKSEYYLRDEQGWLDSSSMIDRLWGSYYYPWERWLMAHPRCRGFFPGIV